LLALHRNRQRAMNADEEHWFQGFDEVPQIAAVQNDMIDD
jgi:hypothetical protein